MSETLVWAFQPLPELNNETGFVTCDAKLAAALIEAEKAQDPRIGAHHFKEIQATSAEYETKVLSARKRKGAE